MTVPNVPNTIIIMFTTQPGYDIALAWVNNQLLPATGYTVVNVNPADPDNLWQTFSIDTLGAETTAVIICMDDDQFQFLGEVYDKLEKSNVGQARFFALTFDSYIHYQFDKTETEEVTA